MHRLRSDDRGFTLIELLVVILIIGILAAIALPSFLGQRYKSRNAEAKSNARNLVTLIEDCFLAANRNRYNIAACDPSAGLSAAIASSGLPYGDQRGQVQIVNRGANSYRISAWADTEEQFNRFNLTKVNGTVYRCRAATSGPACGPTSPRKW